MATNFGEGFIRALVEEGLVDVEIGDDGIERFSPSKRAHELLAQRDEGGDGGRPVRLGGDDDDDDPDDEEEPDDDEFDDDDVDVDVDADEEAELVKA